MKRLLTLTSLGVLLFTAGCAQVANSPTMNENENTTVTSESDTIKIGYVGPLTGDIASLGQDQKKTVELFLEKHPAVNGKKIVPIFEDGICNGQTAASAAEKLINTDKVQVILGGLCSGETLAMAPIAEKNKVLLFSSGSTNPSIKDAGDYIFRNIPSDALAAKQTVEDMQQNGYSKIAILSENTDFAQGFLQETRKNAQTLGLKMVVDETFNPGTTDFKTVLGKIKNSGADVFISNAQTPTGHGLIVRQAKELGLNLPTYANNASNGTEFFEQGKNATEGVIVFEPGLDESLPAAKTFLEGDFKLV